MTSREIFIDVIDDLLRKTDLVAFCGEEDSQKVREGKMTQRQFEKNMNNGKYR